MQQKHCLSVAYRKTPCLRKCPSNGAHQLFPEGRYGHVAVLLNCWVLHFICRSVTLKLRVRNEPHESGVVAALYQVTVPPLADF